MRPVLRTSPVLAALAVVALLAVPALIARAAPTQPARSPRAGICSALGTYQIGPRFLPMTATGRGQIAPPPIKSGRPVTGAATVVWPFWTLRGTISITSYTTSNNGCGGSTLGSFSVRRFMFGPPIERSTGRVPGIACYVPCWQPPAGILSATGSFQQDSTHPNDPTYVMVSATITTTRPGPMLGRPCTEDGCPPVRVISSTVSFNGVTGYLQLGTAGLQSATLSFLPPPAAGSAAAPAEMSLQGWKGPITPSPAPGSTSVR